MGVNRTVASPLSACLAAVLLLAAGGCRTTVHVEPPPAPFPGGGGAKKIIATSKAPAAIGPYSQAVQVGDTLYLSGQIPIDPATGKVVEGGIEAETRQVLENMGAVLRAAGMDFADVVQVQVFLKNLDHYGLVNRIYAECFRDGPPARAAVQVARLPAGVSIEIMATARRGAGGK